MAEFDQYGHKYRSQLEHAIRGLGSVDGAVASKLRVLRGLEATGKIRPKSRILDFGCGTGSLTDGLDCLATERFGVDVSIQSLKHSVAIDSHFALFDGHLLPFRDESFEYVIASCVFHHILPKLRSGVLGEIHRVLAPSGVFVMIEHNPYNPVTRFVVSRCEFDRDAKLLSLRTARDLLRGAALADRDHGYFYAVPPANRVLAGLDNALKRLPLGAQYYCAAAKRTVNAT